jgi:hypothetical protein
VQSIVDTIVHGSSFGGLYLYLIAGLVGLSPDRCFAQTHDAKLFIATQKPGYRYRSSYTEGNVQRDTKKTKIMKELFIR